MTEHPSSRKTSRMALVLSVLGVLGVLVLVGLIAVRVFVLEAFRIPAASMVPTLPIGENFLVDKLFGEVARGDVMVFEMPSDRDQNYVKRVIGLPGEQIEILDGVVYIDDRALERSFVDEMSWTDGNCMEHLAKRFEEGDGDRTWQVLQSSSYLREMSNVGPTLIPEGHYFMLGDNRDNSYDSRFWGTVPADHLVGRMSHHLYFLDPCG